jgi:isochorismate synthase
MSRTAGLAERGFARALAERFQRLVPGALERARVTGSPCLVSAALATSGLDPTATAIASRRHGEPWFSFEQPDRDGFALAGIGCARDLGSDVGDDRFADVAQAWQALGQDSICDHSGEIPGAGLIAFGGFAFAPDGCSSLPWSDFRAASLIVSDISFARWRGESVVTVNVDVGSHDTSADVLNRLWRRLGELRDDTLAMYDPAPHGRYRVASALAPEHYEAAVVQAVARIRSGALEKVVLAREVDVRAPRPYEPGEVLGLLREAYSSSFVYAVGRGESVYLGASPELLIRREGQRASTLALAGSARRSADPATDDHLGEQLLRSAKDREENAIVARRIERRLRGEALWVTSADEPTLVRVANIQHLARPIRAQLASTIGAVQLAGLLHPTPAVGAEPESELRLIPALEGLDRGWYAGPIGWTDTSGDGEFCVALRGALLKGAHARCFAGCGIVAESDPAAELAETEMKFGVMLPALTG